MDNILLRHMCGVAMSAIYNGICAAFLQMSLQSLPQAVLCYYDVVDWRGEVLNRPRFWEYIEFLLELKLVEVEEQDPKTGKKETRHWSIYDKFNEDTKEDRWKWREFTGSRLATLFYQEYNMQVTDRETLKPDEDS